MYPHPRTQRNGATEVVTLEPLTEETLPPPGTDLGLNPNPRVTPGTDLGLNLNPTGT